MMRTLQFVAALAIMALSAVASAQPAGGLSFVRLNYNGTGCPLGSVAQDIAPDQKAFTLLFSQYVADVSPGVMFARKNCQITATLKVPQGWSFAIATVDFRGNVALTPGVSATQKATYYWQGNIHQATASTNFYGPRNEDYTLRDTIGLNSLVWSECNAQRALNINTQVSVQNTTAVNGYGSMSTDSIDGTVEQIYGLQWRRCP